MESDEKITKITTIETKTVHVKIEYWDCGDGHHHKTEDSARRCVEKKEKSKEHQLQRDAIYARNICCARKVVSGSALKDVAEAMCISQTRVGQIITSILRRAWLVGEHKGIPFQLGIYEVRKNKDFWLKQIDLLSMAYFSGHRPGGS